MERIKASFDKLLVVECHCEIHLNDISSPGSEPKDQGFECLHFQFEESKNVSVSPHLSLLLLLVAC